MQKHQGITTLVDLWVFLSHFSLLFMTKGSPRFIFIWIFFFIWIFQKVNWFTFILKWCRGRQLNFILVHLGKYVVLKSKLVSTIAVNILLLECTTLFYYLFSYTNQHDSLLQPCMCISNANLTMIIVDSSARKGNSLFYMGFILDFLFIIKCQFWISCLLWAV